MNGLSKNTFSLTYSLLQSTFLQKIFAIDSCVMYFQVFRLEDHLPLYTLHGHCGPITCLFIDRISPLTAGSGSQDGLLCVWDLLTGM